MRIIIIVLFVLVVSAATSILGHLGAGSVPRVLEPLAVRWIATGRDPKWVRASLWTIFWFLACAFFAFTGFGLYYGAVGLGRDFK